MRRQLGKTTVDPLDLLLDTTCNVFGSVVLIALLMALIATDTSEKVPQAASREDIQRKLRAADQDVAALTVQANKLNGAGDVELIRSVLVLESQVTQSRKDTEKSKAAASQTAEAATLDYTAVSAQNVQAAKEFERDNAILQNELSTATTEASRLSERKGALEQSLDEAKEHQAQELRLPRERTTSKSSAVVIFLRDQVYFKNTFSADGYVSPNTESIDFIRIGDDGHLAAPIPGKGLTLPAAASSVERQLRKVPVNFYMVCYVFPDSIQTFRAFREIAQKVGKEIGWEPILSERDLIFSSSGSAPKPQ